MKKTYPSEPLKYAFYRTEAHVKRCSYYGAILGRVSVKRETTAAVRNERLIYRAACCALCYLT